MAQEKIYEAISNVMKDVGIVEKNGENKFDHYKYRGIDDVMNALNPAMIKYHVFTTPTVLESTRQERSSSNDKSMIYTVLKVQYTFYTDDGSHVDCVVIGEAMDRSDKSSNKAMSAAFKYACFQVFCIPTEEMRDTEAESLDAGMEAVDPDLLVNGQGMTESRITKLKAEMKRTGISEIKILDTAKVKAIKEMSEETYIAIMNKLHHTPDKSEKQA